MRCIACNAVLDADFDETDFCSICDTEIKDTLEDFEPIKDEDEDRFETVS